jgi:hypothetical protein
MMRFLLATVALLELSACHKRAAPESATPTVVCPEPCAEGTTCKLVQVQCVRAPCPPIAECVPAK